MKKYNFLTNASLMFILLSTLLLITCKKDDEDSSQDNYRITKTEWYANQQLLDSALYEYQGEKLTLVKGYYYGEENDRMTVEYPDANSVVMRYSYFDGSSWYDSDKESLKLENGRVTEYMDYEYDGTTWNPYSKEVYSYINDKIVEFIEYDYLSGSWVPNYKTVYEYESDKPMQAISYYYDEYGGAGWQISYKEVITYDGDKFNYLIGYDYYAGSYTEEMKVVFHYSDNLMTGYTEYYYDSGTWSEGGSITYTYDTHNNLSSMSMQDTYDSYKIVYLYEKGKGNYSQIENFYGYGFYTDLLPHPTKVKPGNKTHMPHSMGKFFEIK